MAGLNFSEGFARRLAIGVLTGLVAGVVLTFVTADGLTIAGGSLGGDYPAFYGAGKIVASGQGGELYDWSRQAAVQKGLHAEGDDAVLVFTYPAYVAVLFAPLGMLPFLASFALYMALCAAALAATVAMVRPMLPTCKAQAPVLLLLLVTCYPLIASVLGGQNTAFSLLLLASIWRFLVSGDDLHCGIAAGLLLFKPQFGIPVLLLLAVAGRRPRVLLGALPVAILFYILGALAVGADWPLAWWQSTMRFQSLTRVVEASNTVGIVGLFAAQFGADNGPARITGWLITLAAALALAYFWYRRRAPSDTLFAVTACVIALLPPHAIFYDAGLAGLALLLLFERAGSTLSRSLALLLLLSWSVLLNDVVGFSPAILFLLVTIALVMRSDTERSVPPAAT
jgi:hypothetical protein